MFARPRASRQFPPWVPIAAIAVLALVVAIVVVAALDRGQGASPDAAPAPVPTFTLHTPEPVAEEPSPTPEPAPEIVLGPERFLSVGSDGALWRGTAGECGGEAPTLELSTDRGETWQGVNFPSDAAARLLRLEASDRTIADVLIAVGDECEVELYRTYSSGAQWQDNTQSVRSWSYASPTEEFTVQVRGEAVPAPCARPTDVSATNDAVTIVCDGTAYENASDSDWVALDAPGHVLAIANAADGPVFASVTEACTGVTITRVGDETCVDAAPDATAIAAQSASVWLWSGESVTNLGGS